LKTTIKTIKIRTNSCKNKTQMERRREDEMRNGEKINHGGGGMGFILQFFRRKYRRKIE
jgi:hypothetical protein